MENCTEVSHKIKKWATIYSGKSYFWVIAVLSHSLCPTLWGPVDCSPPGSSVHGIFQARILEWVTISSSRDLPDPGIESRSPELQADSLLVSHLGSPFWVFSSVQFIRSVLSDSLWPHELQHARAPCPSSIPRVYPNSYTLSQWCHLIISSSVIPLCSCLQSFPAPGSFQMSQLIISGGQNNGVLASTSVLPMNIQDWFPWGVLESKRLSRVFSNTIVQKH